VVSDVWASRCPSVATPTAPRKDLSEEEICKRLADFRSRDRGDLSQITWEALALRSRLPPGGEIVGTAGRHEPQSPLAAAGQAC
jgi:hypothetical protein